MNNVFDLVADFYGQDEEWNTVLRQSYVENFLRAKSWQGASDEELTEAWDYITLLCLYLGNSENFLGDMSRDDFIDCIAWCGRNVADFRLTDKRVTKFLDVMIELYAHLYNKKIIMSGESPVEAKAKLLPEGKLTMMDYDGKFLPEHNKFNLYSTADLPAKIFLNIGDRLNDLVEAMRKFFSQERFLRDIERAAFMYSGILLTGAVEEKPGTEEYAQCFWDYFLFDHYMINSDEHPIKHFYNYVCEDRMFSEEGAVSKDVLEELIKARLVLFSVEGFNEEGTYRCRDFMTGQIYNLMLPIEADTKTEEFLFLGHIFYNETMVMNFLRGMTVPKRARKKLYEVLTDAKAWFATRNGGEMSWDEFVSRNAMFIRHVTLIFSAYVRMDGFNYTTKVENYLPMPIDQEDRVVQCIKAMMKPYAFSAYDIMLTQRIWSDYKAHYNNFSPRLADVWAAGAIKNFIDANNIYNYDLAKVAEMCRNIPSNVIGNCANQIQSTLGVEEHDPRYINEEGLLLMLLS